MLSSPVKGLNPKKLLPIHKQKKASPTDNTSPQKQDAVDLLERKQEALSPVVVTETKQKQQKYKSSEEENSTGSENDLSVIQVKMSTSFATKLKHLLNNYVYAKNDKHNIW